MRQVGERFTQIQGRSHGRRRVIGGSIEKRFLEIKRHWPSPSRRALLPSHSGLERSSGRRGDLRQLSAFAYRPDDPSLSDLTWEAPEEPTSHREPAPTPPADQRDNHQERPKGKLSV